MADFQLLFGVDLRSFADEMDSTGMEADELFLHLSLLVLTFLTQESWI